MAKPKKTAADYMVIALSPALIMVLVGSLCFFLIEVFYRSQVVTGIHWVMFWFILAIVLVSRIAIEESSVRAALYGFALAFVTWLYIMQTQPAGLLGALLLGIVWFCAHKLVFDCTLIDENEDSSGRGLLQKAPVKSVAKPPPTKKPAIKPIFKQPGKRTEPQSPGRWVIYFSLAALPLFGIGQVCLPADGGDARRLGLRFLIVYLAAALSLLVTTSFLGLRRYLRQRFLKMPPGIALAWLKFGVGVGSIVLIGAVFLPRPGANEAWTELRYWIDYKLKQASQYATAPNPPGKGEGKPGEETGGKQGDTPKPGQDQGNKPSSGEQKPGQTQSPSQGNPAPTPAPISMPGGLYSLLRIGFWISALVVIGGWIIRNWGLLAEMLKSIVASIREFLQKFLALAPYRKTSKPEGPVFPPKRHTLFSDYKNPFFAAKDFLRTPEEIMIYTYEAVQVWAKEEGVPDRPELTAREFCGELAQSHPDLEREFNHLARLYAYAAYGKQLPANSDLEPIKELWRRMPTAAHAVAGPFHLDD